MDDPLEGTSSQNLICEEVILVIEDNEISYKKNFLIMHSDFFKAMFDERSNYVERQKEKIHLFDTDLHTFQVTMKVANNFAFILDYPVEVVIKICETACRYAIHSAISSLDYWISLRLTKENCAQLWFAARRHNLQNTPKLKVTALPNFEIICYTDFLYEMDLNMLCEYLGNMFISPKNEAEVFHVALRWTTQIYSQNYSESKEEALIKLLYCIDIKMLTNEDIATCCVPVTDLPQVHDIFECIVCLRQNQSSTKFSEKIKAHAERLMKSRSRCPGGYPCIVVKKEAIKYSDDLRISEKYDAQNNRTSFALRKLSRSPQKRTRTYSTPNIYKAGPSRIDVTAPKKDPFSLIDNYKIPKLATFYFDIHDGAKLKGLIDIALPYFESQPLIIFGHKNYVYYFGGIDKEKFITKGWQYDPVKGYGLTFELGFKKHDMEYCIIGSYLYFCGGFRKDGKIYAIWDAKFQIFDLDTNTFVTEKSLPIENEDIKCCNFKNQLTIFSAQMRSLYILSPSDEWQRIPISFFEENARMGPLRNRIMFTYDEHLYLYYVNEDLIEICFTDDRRNITLKRQKNSETIFNEPLSSIMIHNDVYSFIKSKDILGRTVNLNKFNLETMNCSTLFAKDIMENAGIVRINDEETWIYRFLPQCYLFKAIPEQEADTIINYLYQP